MIKLIMNKFGPGLLDKWWASLHHPSGFAIRYVFWTTALVVIVVAFFAKDVPWKGKTLPELYIGNEVEQYRLHQNSSDWYALDKELRRLTDDCNYLSRLVDKYQSNIYQLEASDIPKDRRGSLVRRAEASLRDAEKKFEVARVAKLAITHSLDELVAQR